MLFQTLDDKEQCIAVYTNGELQYGTIPENLTKTWGYASYLDDRDIQFANIYFGGNNPGPACPDCLKEQWEQISNKLEAFFRSFEEAKVDLNENCFFDLVPEKYLLKYCEIKNKITKHVLENHEKPKNYDFLTNLIKVVKKIQNQKLNIDTSVLNNRIFDFKTRQICKKIKNSEPYVKYDIFGTRTGRLTTIKNSFPILTLAKEYRKVISPYNDWFVELDFNAAELRTLLALSGKEQPKEDLHEWNLKNVYRNIGTREEAKQRIFAWLYNPESKDYLSNRAYERDKVLTKYWDGNCVKTCFHREIEADKHHALNYIIQSTTSDLFLDRVIEVFNFLKNRKSFISFCIHDSLVIDFSNEDKEILTDLKRLFSDTKLGIFRTNMSAGKNFGKMKKLEL